MNKKDLELKISGLEKAITTCKDETSGYENSLKETQKQLADINKPELTPSQLDDVYEAIEEGIRHFDFSDSDNYDKEFGIDYDGRVHFENLELTNSQDLVEVIVEKVSKLFVEAECSEELDTTEDDNHPIEKLQN